MQHMTAADGIAVDHGNHGLGQAPYLHLHIQNTEAGHSLLVDISPTSFHVHVASRAECFVAGSGEKHHAYVSRFTAVGKGDA